MSKQLYDALEYCLHAIEDGADPEAVLARYPRLAAELRPLLGIAEQARVQGISEPSAEAMRLGRARLLQRAVQMRSPRRRSVLPLVQRLAFSLALATVFLLSGTGLVKASSSTLPGDNLYPVKRTWEDVRLLFVFTPGHRDALEGEYEQERLSEVSELLQKGRTSSISFTGLITSQRDGEIIVSGVPVAISAQTQFSGTQAILGASVIVIGQTDPQGHVIALHVQVLPPGTVVPLGEPETESSGSGATNGQEPEGNSEGQKSGGAQESFHLEGTVQSVQGNTWIVDGKTVYLAPGILNAAVPVGTDVEVEGYFASDGRFVVTKFEIKDSGEGGGSTEGEQNSEEQHPTEQPEVEPTEQPEVHSTEEPEEHPTEQPEEHPTEPPEGAGD